ncbi:hypothetical protein ACFCYH_36785 [Streptomyces sp. NPDC056400]|uniref:hypothetical protein n=1 Tax=Streptomyces sp. NPDC056400 TaxID=3345808 RepID=UPI0035D696AC
MGPSSRTRADARLRHNGQGGQTGLRAVRAGRRAGGRAGGLQQDAHAARLVPAGPAGPAQP